ncbi:melanopsin-like [Heterodontus francisci]|uniref:melanopsin-like n=1 Tax=Heterodontus francisci TaxID=7792 RepID=UPI00355B787C
MLQHDSSSKTESEFNLNKLNFDLDFDELRLMKLVCIQMLIRMFCQHPPVNGTCPKTHCIAAKKKIYELTSPVIVLDAKLRHIRSLLDKAEKSNLNNCTSVLNTFKCVHVNKKLRTPPNFFIMNLAISDLLMSASQSPVFFISSLNKRWLFGDIGCELYGFCGALFGITSMITLMVISIDRYRVITKPLQSLGLTRKKNTQKIILAIWLYSLVWSLPPLFGWNSYILEGLMTSCTWDYVTTSPSHRSYTLMLCCFVFFVPLIVISYCYVCMFKAIKSRCRDIETMGSYRRKIYVSQQQTMKHEWQLAKVAFVANTVFVLSWSPYACVALIGCSGHGDILTPYSKSIPALLAKVSATYNPIIYTIIHPKYRATLAKGIPCLHSSTRKVKKDFVSDSTSDFSVKELVLSCQFFAMNPTVVSLASSRETETLSSNSETKKQGTLSSDQEWELVSGSLSLAYYPLWIGNYGKSQCCSKSIADNEENPTEDDVDVFSDFTIPHIVSLYEDILPSGRDALPGMSTQSIVQIQTDQNYIESDIFRRIPIWPTSDQFVLKYNSVGLSI